jgi:hypothetical protein
MVAATLMLASAVGFATWHMKQTVKRSAVGEGRLRTESFTARSAARLPRGDQTPSIAVPFPVPGLPPGPTVQPPGSTARPAGPTPSSRRRTAAERLALARSCLSRGLVQQALVHLPVAASVGEASPDTYRQIIELYQQVVEQLPGRLGTPAVRRELEGRLAELRSGLDQRRPPSGPRGPSESW